MANYIFSVDGAETGAIGLFETAFVYNLDFFDTTDTVTASLGTLDFDIDGDIDLDLTGYAGITGFSMVTARSATGDIHLTIGQDFYGVTYSLALAVVAQSDVHGAVVLDASALTNYQSVLLDARSDGHNVLTGGAYDDYLSGGAGADRFEGGGGIDQVDLSDSSAAVTVDLAAGTGIGGVAQGDTYISIESVQGSAFADRLIGVGGGGQLNGNGGNDVLIARVGYVFGGSGDDVLIVSNSIARCFGGPGIDQVNFKIDPDGAGIDLLDNDQYEDKFTDIENVYGSESRDYFYGNAGPNVLEGVGGDDSLKGRGGSDVLRGGAGADKLDGGSGDGSDTVSYWLSSVGVTVNLATGTGHGGDAEGDTLTGFEILSGSQGNDFLTGDVFANTLQGWNGDDVLEGGIGKDVLTGGAGADRFVFTTIGDSLYGANADRITDFSLAQGDKIDLSAVYSGPFSEFYFIGQRAYSIPGQAGAVELRYAFTSPNTTTIAGELDGDAVSDFHIVLSGYVYLDGNDFVL
ncbi:MAG: calcium-binding protein [Inquilinus sp.]|uniref:calcium-binding protein n=1 Tax=Inquilinus sp. TaxID=1932117 RepID=UPI003F29F74E